MPLLSNLTSTIIKRHPLYTLSFRFFPLMIGPRGKYPIYILNQYKVAVLARRLINSLYEHEQYKILPYELKKTMLRKTSMIDTILKYHNMLKNTNEFRNNVRLLQQNRGLTNLQKDFLSTNPEMLNAFTSFTKALLLVHETIIPIDTNVIYAKHNTLSGLKYFTKDQRKLLNDHNVLTEKEKKLSLEFKKLLVGEMIHITYNFTSQRHNTLEENLFHAIKNIFAAVPRENMSQDLYNLIGKDLLPLTQSLCVYFWGNSTFDAERFINFCRTLGINADSFKKNDIHISHFIEAYFLKQCLSTIEKHSSFTPETHLINNNGIDHLKNIFNPNESLDRTNQMHCDALMIGKNTSTEVSGKNLKLYIDLKSYVTFSTKYCRFSLFHASIPLLQRYIADISNMIRTYVNDNAIIEGPIYALYEDILEIKKRKMIKNDLEEYKNKFNDMLSLIVQASVSPKTQVLRLAYAQDAGIDSNYIEFYKNVVVPHMENIDNTIMDLNNMIPEKSEIDNQTHFTAMHTFFSTMLPEEIRKDAVQFFVENVTRQITS